jgi:hypothetical protein
VDELRAAYRPGLGAPPPRLAGRQARNLSTLLVFQGCQYPATWSVRLPRAEIGAARCSLPVAWASDPAIAASGLMPQGRRGRSGLATILMTRADLRAWPRARRFLSCSSVGRSSVSVSMNNLTNMGCTMFLLQFSCFTPRRAAGRGWGTVAGSPARRAGSRPCRRTRSLRCTADSIPARVMSESAGGIAVAVISPGGHGGWCEHMAHL